MRYKVFRKKAVLYLCLLCAVVSTPPARACDIPVFRYAMEHWAPDPYEVILFHRTPLDDEVREAISRLQTRTANGDLSINLLFRRVDLAEPMDPSTQQLWQRQSASALPWMVVRYAPAAQSEEAVWSGPFEVATVERLVDSPLRREIGRRLLDGQSAVWVLLESGDRTRDDQAARRLRARLREAAEQLQLPVPSDDGSSDSEAAEVLDLWIEFSMVRLSRNDSAEQLLVAMLLHSEYDLRLSTQVMAFPIFGRGRALYALVGDGIDDANIRQACAFIVGACSCQIKELCPGRDLLMAVDWGSLLDDDLPSFADLAQASALFDTIAGDTAAVGAGTEESGALGRNLLLVLLIGGLGVGVATIAMNAKSRRSGGRG